MSTHIIIRILIIAFYISYPPDKTGSIVILKIKLVSAISLFFQMICFLHCSDSGLSELELRALLAYGDDDDLPMMIWVKVRRRIKPYILNAGMRDDEEIYSFFHSSVYEVCHNSSVSNIFLVSNVSALR